MKNAITLLACATLAAALSLLPASSAWAQTDAAPDTSTNQTVRPRRTNGIQLQLDRLDKQLTLSAEQKVKVKTILEDIQKKRLDARKENTGSSQDLTAKYRALRDDERSKIKDLLTDDQKKKYDELNNRQRRRQPAN